MKKYTFRSDHGVGHHQISLALDVDNMPICFDTFMDWVHVHIEPRYRWMAWKLVHEEAFDEAIEAKLKEKNT